MFKLELVIKYKNLSSAWIGLIIGQVKLELNIFWAWDPTQVYYQTYIKFII